MQVIINLIEWFSTETRFTRGLFIMLVLLWIKEMTSRRIK